MFASARYDSAPETGSLEDLTAFLKAAADPSRLEVLQVLGQNSFGVLELSEILRMRQSGMSHHLKVLARAGLVEQRREGNSSFYRRALPAEADRLHQSLLERLDRLALSEGPAQRLAQVQRQRADRSQRFFQRSGEAMDPGQDLIADFDRYGELACRLLDRALPGGGGEALEVGPGDGRFLGSLATRFERVTALESTEPMLAQSRQRISDEGLDSVHLASGEWPHSAPPRQFDAVVMNMVLHHLPEPAESFVAAARRLRRGGVLLVTELCRHDQAWTRERCGDLWLGFDGAELAEWADRAGLVPGESQFLALRNGFQVQVRTFTHRYDNAAMERSKQ